MTTDDYIPEMETPPLREQLLAHPAVEKLRAQKPALNEQLSAGARWCVRLVTKVGEGSINLGRGLLSHLIAWCRRGHRDDLKGIKADLGPIARGLILAGAGAILARAVDRHHGLMWPLLGAWYLAALRAAKGDWPKPPKQATKKTNEQAPAEAPVVALVRSLIGDDEGVHLGELYPAMREQLEGLAEATDEQLRQTLTDHRIEVARTVRSRGIAGRTGVRRSALPPLPSPATPLQNGSSPLSTDGDAGQGTSTESSGEQRRADGDPAESGGEHTVHLTQDPDNPAHWLVQR